MDIKSMGSNSEQRTTISVRGARQNNLKNVDVDIPRDRLSVITGVSGSGKSSLAFEVIYAEGQRRFLESISTFARRRIDQVRRADVDYVYGLSPVVAIEQKTGMSNPRSTVGTMTTIHDYLRLLYATSGTPHCPVCGKAFETRSVNAMVEHLLRLPEGTKATLLCPVNMVYGEPWSFVIDEVRKKGYRTVWVDGVPTDITGEIEWDDDRAYRLDVVIDEITLRDDRYKVLAQSIESGVKRVGEGYMRFEVEDGAFASDTEKRAFYQDFACPDHHIAMVETNAFYFSFNDAENACRTCMGIGMHKQADPRLMIVSPEKSINKGALASFVYNANADWSYKQVIMYSLSEHYGFSLDTPWKDLPDGVRDLVFHGTRGEKVTMRVPEGVKKNWIAGRTFAYGGLLSDINRWYKHWREKPVSSTREEEALNRVMVETVCPDCGSMRLKPQRLLVRVGGLTITQAARLNLPEFVEFLGRVSFSKEREDAGRQVVAELRARVNLLLEIGLYYLNLDRRADSLSGGEAQRIRLSTQISSGLMGMLYVLDEPSIGLHARDGERIIAMLRKLRDIGNTVIVVEHDMETIRAADYMVEVGPGAGASGGRIIAAGTPAQLERGSSLTGEYLSGKKFIPLPEKRRGPSDEHLVIRGAREHNLRDVTVSLPLHRLICITGVSGSGKSTLVHDILYKKLHQLRLDPRTIPGDHDAIEGASLISNVISIDQSPIGRNSRSNPATYVGFYDRICELFASTPDALERGYAQRDFSFNAKEGGRCEECAGTGVIVRELEFMADIETICPVCGGARFQKELLEVKYKGKNIADALDMPLEDAVSFFGDQKYIRHKIATMNSLGLGYLRLGQSSTTLSGGEAQRVKLATELGKIKRGAHNLYILDEPTTGLHIDDIRLLIGCLDALVDSGHTVLVIEHHLDVIKRADHVVDMGPEGGKQGGFVVAEGTPEEVARAKGSHTGRYLRENLR